MGRRPAHPKGRVTTLTLYLASSLNNLSVSLREAGDEIGAQSVIREAVETYRRLAQQNPMRYEPDLATGLNNLSNRLGETEDGAEPRETEDGSTPRETGDF